MGRDDEILESTEEVRPIKKQNDSGAEKVRKKKRPAAAEGSEQAERPVKKKKRPADSDGSDRAGQPVRKKKRPANAGSADTSEQPVRKKKRTVSADSTDTSEQPVRKKRRQVSAESAGTSEQPVRKKKRPAPADGGEPVRKKRRPENAEGDEPVRKKKRPTAGERAGSADTVRKKRSSIEEAPYKAAEPGSGGKPEYVETVNADGIRERRTSTYSFLPDEPEPDPEVLRKQKEEEEQKELENGLLAEEELREGEHSEEERRAKRRAAKQRAARKRAAEARKMRRIAIAAGALVIILLFGFLIAHRMSGNSEKSESQTDAARTTEQAEGTDISTIPADESVASAAVITPEPVSASITLTFTGDCTFGRDQNFDYDTSFDAFYEENGPEYFFANCKSIFEQDDLTVVNFEGTLTNADSSERLDKQYAFKADPSYVQILTSASVEAANMANNHSEDYGEQSYTDTLQYLSEAGITTFGYSDSKVVDVKGIKVGLVGILELFEEMDCQDDMIEQIEAVKAQGAQIVVVTMHWGEEAQYYYDQDQYDLGRIAIDHGADLVIGHHPHRIQAIETYKGKNIVYSLANFSFGGNFEPSDMDSFIYQQTFTVTGGQLVEDNVTNIIPISISSSSSYNNYQPTPYEDQDEIDRILFKIADLTTEPGVPLTGGSSQTEASSETTGSQDMTSGTQTSDGETSEGTSGGETYEEEEYSEEDEEYSEEYSEDYYDEEYSEEYDEDYN